MGKKIAIDTYYREDSAKTVGVIFNNWEDSSPIEIVEATSTDFGPYIPGKFYLRELPCILDLIKKIPDIMSYEVIIIDGLARLPGSWTEGLGIHLFDALSEIYPEYVLGGPGPAIMGIAKSKFQGADDDNGTGKVYRGEAKTPLYTNTNWHHMSTADAIENLAKMHGQYRIPTLLKLLDKLTKEVK